ncbi:XRE family transcriptional regulator [bacterium]|nr:MAG: XRE family transcriptional regulator [bacterium]
MGSYAYSCCMDAAQRHTLRTLLKDRNRSEIARRLGVDPTTVHRWYHGDTVPTGPRLLELARALGVDAASIDFPRDRKR